MNEKTNSSIYHFKNYIQIQKLNCILKIRFSNDELGHGVKKKSKQSMRSKQNGALEFTVRSGSHIEKIRELMFQKYFIILLVSKS